jgi:Uma2 family endonuclease
MNKWRLETSYVRHRQLQWTAAEYLAFERNSPNRHEYDQGEVFPMAGASKKHNNISTSLLFIFYGQLRGRNCEVYGSDMRVGIPTRQLYTYPDLSALCGDAQFEDETEDILLNPQVIIEVLSPSTEKYDQGLKFEHYKALASFQEYLLISQEEPGVQHHWLEEGAWLSQSYTALGDSFTLKAIPCVLTLAEIYEQVAFGD